MNFDTFADLNSAISQELNRTDMDSVTPAFIRLSEAQTERTLRVRQMMKVVTLSAEAEFEVLPDDFLEVRNVSLSSHPSTPLRFVSIEGAEEFRQQNHATGKPSIYTIVGDKLRFLKVPEKAYGATLIYFAKIPKLSAQVQSNWLLNDHPDIYFYGALIQSAPYLKDDARLQLWSSLYSAAIDALRTSDQRAQTASSGLTISARTF